MSNIIQIIRPKKEKTQLPPTNLAHTQRVAADRKELNTHAHISATGTDPGGRSSSASRCLPQFGSASRSLYEFRGARHPGSFRALRMFPCRYSLWPWASAEKSERLAQSTQWHTEHLIAGCGALFPSKRW